MKKTIILLFALLAFASCSKKDDNPMGQKIRPIEHTKWKETDKSIPYGIGQSSYVHLWFDSNDQGTTAFENDRTGQFVGYFDMTYSYNKSTGNIEIKFTDDHDNSYDWTGSYIYGILFVDGAGYKKE